MSINRLAKRVDANQQQIVDRLRACSVSVEIIGKPVDLLVCCRGENVLMEVKGKDGRLTKAQVEFISRWPGRVEIVRSPDDALSALGIV
jgi:hypothetical protein